MAQASDNTVDNGTGAAVRADINARIAALYTNHSGSTDTTMTTKYPYQTWFDTSTSPGVLKYRNSGNTSWVSFRDADGMQHAWCDIKSTVESVSRVLCMIAHSC